MFLQLLLNVFEFFLNFIFAGILRWDKSVLWVSAVSLVLPAPCLVCPTECSLNVAWKGTADMPHICEGKNILSVWLLLSALAFSSDLMHVTNKFVCSAQACCTHFIESQTVLNWRDTWGSRNPAHDPARDTPRITLCLWALNTLNRNTCSWNKMEFRFFNTSEKWLGNIFYHDISEVFWFFLVKGKS